MKHIRKGICAVVVLCLLLTLLPAAVLAEAPVLSGFTAFVFDGDTLTVIPGTDGNYEITGINPAGEEYTLGGTPALNAPQVVDGCEVYQNTADYKLCVNIKKNGGDYVFRGNGADMCICVGKGAVKPANLYLDNLTLTSSFTAPITVKKDSMSSVNIIAVDGTENVLTDAARNNADLYGDPTEDGGDGSNAVYAESAVIKAKNGARLNLGGTGTLTLCCNSKNAIKVAENGKLTISDLTLNITSTNHGISSDNLLEIRSGTLTITAAEDGIRSDPDAVDAENGCAGSIHINTGKIKINAGSDCIQAAQDLCIGSGEFTLTAGGGSSSKTFNENTMSCKGLKASANTDEAAETADATNTITINGGTFTIDTVDDAIHSDAHVIINGGSFSIKTGDDGVHADTTLTLGTQGADDALIDLSIEKSYEGLEAGNVYIYSGTYSVLGSDDGINAAGDSSNSGFNPGGGPGGRPGGGGPGGPGGPGGSGDYSINIAGGKVFVNVSGDGLDSNGNLNLTGGNIVVWGQQAGGDNEPLDCDGTLLIKGATVFAAGSRMMTTTPGSGSQSYVRYSGSNISAGKTVNVKKGTTVIYQTTALKQINYVLYSSPSVTSSGWTITADSSAVPQPVEETYDCAKSGHSWDNGYISVYPTCTQSGTKTYTCIHCGQTREETVEACGHTEIDGTCVICGAAEGETPEGFTVSFATGEGAAVTTYLTQDTAAVCETNAVTALARNSETGEIDISGDGQCNFSVNVADGYELVSVTADANYKNLKTPEETGNGTYRLTKITGSVTVTVVTKKTDESCEHSYENGYCVLCGEEDPNAEWFTVCFETDEGAAVTTYLTQDASKVYEENAVSAYARSSSDGRKDISGDGQCNFSVNVADGYELVSVTADANYKNLKTPEETGNGTYRLTKITGSVTVTVVTEKTDEPPVPADPCEGYTDIDREAWYHDAADFVIERGLMGSTRTDALTFEPSTSCTRSMIVMILYNIAGTPDVSYVAKFPDVPDGQWYTKAVMWAYQNGIVSGYDNGKFGPNDKVTREQMAVVLKGYADFIGKDTSKTADLSKFPDGNKATWSKSYISWAVAEGLISGKAQDGKTYLDPQGVATRAEVAALIRGFVLNILEAK